MTRLADRAYPPRLPAFFLSLMLPRKEQPFPPERRNCSHTLRGVLQFRLPSAPQRYNTLDFPGKVVCQQGCCSPLLETQSQRSYAPLDTSRFVAVQICACPNLYHAQPPKTQIPHTSSYVGRNMRDFLFAIIRRSNLAIKCIVEDWLSI